MPADNREFITLALDFPDHPKFADWSDAAKFKLIRLWIYCARHRTDGFVPAPILRQICRKDVTEKLRKIDGVAWLEDGSGIVFTDYTEHQRTRAQAAQKRDKASSAGVKSGEVRRAASRADAVAAATDQAVCHRTYKEDEEKEKTLRASHSTSSLTPHSPSEGDTPQTPHGGNILFDSWWRCYPRKVGKPAARRSFETALKKISIDELMQKTAEFVNDPNLPSGDQIGFIPHPSTWLNQERWNDLPLPPRRENRRRKSATERVIAAMEIGQKIPTTTIAPDYSVPDFPAPKALTA